MEQGSEETGGMSLLSDDVLRDVAARVPASDRPLARLVCKSWAVLFAPTSRTLIAEQPSSYTLAALTAAPALPALTLRSLSASSTPAAAFAPHLSVCASHAHLTRLALERPAGSFRTSPDNAEGSGPESDIAFPKGLRALSLSGPGPWSGPLLQALGKGLGQLTELTLGRLGCAEAAYCVPWEGLTGLRRLELRLGAAEVAAWPKPGPAAPAASSEAAAGASVPTLAAALAAALPALQELSLLELPSPADDTGTGALLAAIVASAGSTDSIPFTAASCPPDAPYAPTAAAAAAEDDCTAAAAAVGAWGRAGCLLRLSFRDAADDCDYLSAVAFRLGNRARDGTDIPHGTCWSGAGVSGTSGGAAAAANCGWPAEGDKEGWSAVEVSARVMVVTGGEDKSESESASLVSGEHSGEASPKAREDGDEEGSEGSCADEGQEAEAELGSRALEELEDPAGATPGQPGGAPAAGAAVSGAAGGVTEDVTSALEDLLALWRLALVPLGANSGSVQGPEETAQALEGLQLSPSPEASAAAAAPTTAPAAAPSAQGSPLPSPRRCCAFAAVACLDVVLCCDASAGRSGRPLRLDLSALPGLSSLTLRLFSDTVATSYSRGADLALLGVSALTALQLLRSDGAAPPPELAGGLAAALAERAPRLRRFVAEGAVLSVAVEAEGGERGKGRGAEGLAALPQCRRLEELTLWLLPTSRPPRYSRRVRLAWLPPSLRRLVLYHVDLDAADLDPDLDPSQSCDSADPPHGSWTCLPDLHHLELHLCRAPSLVPVQAPGPYPTLTDAGPSHCSSRSRSSWLPSLTHLSLSHSSTQGANGAAIAGAWPRLQSLSVSASLSPDMPSALPAAQPTAPAGGSSSSLSRDPKVLLPEDVAALGSLTGLRSLYWHAPHTPGGLAPATLAVLPCLSGLRRLGLHLGLDNTVTPEELVAAVGALGAAGCGRLSELDLVVGHGPCRAAVGSGREAGVAGGGLGGRLAEAVPHAVVTVRRD
ncbi:hypothetical protein HYH03_004787 [Edaphochlamys debaryana]|uniref:F-box domain-containing protein n=1 Tax=Edaphochlamys debaryana TaxID=47281 RepID=A0A835Y9F7_9CHLO|nr:hypothetical protein HYH03_004787 [Edaphochlamys debaryana]|eukprot:KAG2497198.1 hypothetical protein HYH03_004787 [Edaphochlamys debaryana]